MTYPFEGSSNELTSPFADDTNDLAGDHIESDLDGDLTETATPDVSESTEPRKPSRRKAPRSAVRLSAAQVRRVLSQADVVERLSESERNLLAATLGTTASTEDLVVSTLSASKAGDLIVELLAIASEEDQFKPVILAHTLLSERDNARRAWALLTALGKVSGGIPAKDIQAATVVAAAAKELSLEDLAGLELVTELLG